MGSILVGTASWTDKTLLASGWYPKDASSAEDRLGFYASQFPLVEVDSTYYAPPAQRTAELWRDRTPEHFTFNIKAFSLFTQHPTRPASLPKDLREQLGNPSANLYAGKIDPAVTEEMWGRFLGALAPLHESGKLGVILFQFPQWFVIGRPRKDYLLECQARCDPVPACVEFRSHSWMSERNQAETLDFLRRHKLPYVSVDMPQGYPSSVPPVLAATAPLAVVRFHGHSGKWTSNDIHKRFGYRYSEDEMKEWAPRVRDLAGDADVTHVVMNNCYRDYAQVNARQLADLLATPR